jgi:hypothetical protein
VLRELYLLIYLALKNSRGQKRLFQNILDLNENESLVGSSSQVSYTDFMNLKKQCLDLESRIKKLEEEWMRK